ncbi:MAG: hypothetical protein WD002_10895 [Pseudomonadales bacterium]
MSGPKVKTLALIALPILISGIIITWVSAAQMRSELQTQTSRFGHAMVDQLATTITDPMVQRDVLSLNVILSDLLEKGDFAFASVYSTDNRLLAQVGRNRSNLQTFTRDVVFQNASPGYVQLGLDHSGIDARVRNLVAMATMVLITLVAFIFLLVWHYGDFLYFWWSAPESNSGTADKSSDTNAESTTPEIEDITGDLTILVIKVRPVRLLEANLDKINSALSLYRGEVELTVGDDIVVKFSTHDQVFQAVFCGTLVASILRLTRGSKQVKLGLHVASLTEGDDVAKAIKHAKYLASISDNKLLSSRKVFAKVGQSDRIALQEFHSSLTPDGEVYFVESLSPANAALIERQARQFV